LFILFVHSFFEKRGWLTVCFFPLIIFSHAAICIQFMLRRNVFGKTKNSFSLLINRKINLSTTLVLINGMLITLFSSLIFSDNPCNVEIHLVINPK